MAVDSVTLMKFESGEMSEEEVVEMLSEMLKEGEIDNFDEKFAKLSRRYIRKGLLDEEGSINYIKLKGE